MEQVGPAELPAIERDRLARPVMPRRTGHAAVHVHRQRVPCPGASLGHEHVELVAPPRPRHDGSDDEGVIAAGRDGNAVRGDDLSVSHNVREQLEVARWAGLVQEIL